MCCVLFDTEPTTFYILYARDQKSERHRESYGLYYYSTTYPFVCGTRARQARAPHITSLLYKTPSPPPAGAGALTAEGGRGAEHVTLKREAR